MILGPTYVYLAWPRTATNATAFAWLGKHYHGVDRPPHHNTDVPGEHQGKFIWGVTRNPYDRMLSVWYHLVFAKAPVLSENNLRTPTELARYVIDHRLDWPAGQSASRFFDAAPRVDRILRYEDLANEVKSLPFYDPRYPFPAEIINHQPRGKLEDDLTPEFIAAVNDHSAADFERFGYEKL